MHIVKEKIVMLGVAVPEDVMDKLIEVDHNPQIQTHKLSWAIIRGMECNGEIIDIISTIAVSDYPSANLICSGYRKWDRKNGSDNWLVPFINILGLKQLTRFISSFSFLLWWSIKNFGKKRHVLIYGLISSHLYAVRCIKLLFRTKATIIITDLPGLAVASDPWWKRILRPLDSSLVHSATQYADGVIVLTRQISEDFVPKVPAMVMEGILSVESEEMAKNIRTKLNDTSKDFIILYAGALGKNYGIPLLLDAFVMLVGEDYRLCFFGRGDMVDDIRCRVKTDSRISLSEDFISAEDLFIKCQQSTVLINPRPTNEIFTRYSFPSKIIEYMAVGRPVVTTQLLSIPSDYHPYLIWLDQETPEALAALFENLRNGSDEQLCEIGEKSRDFVIREKNYRYQGKRIVDFIKQISSM